MIEYTIEQMKEDAEAWCVTSNKWDLIGVFGSIKDLKKVGIYHPCMMGSPTYYYAWLASSKYQDKYPNHVSLFKECVQPGTYFKLLESMEKHHV